MRWIKSIPAGALFSPGSVAALRLAMAGSEVARFWELRRVGVLDLLEALLFFAEIECSPNRVSAVGGEICVEARRMASLIVGEGATGGILCRAITQTFVARTEEQCNKRRSQQRAQE